MSRSLIVMPDDSAQPILEAIKSAKKSLRIKMFLFSDPALLSAVIAAQKRGVKVRVMLNPARRGGEPENEATRKKLEKAGVDVIVERHAAGQAFLVVSHDIPAIMRLCPRTVCMNAGAVIADGLTETVMADHAVVEAYLGGHAAR